MAVKLQEQEKYYGIFKKQPEIYGNETIYTAQVFFIDVLKINKLTNQQTPWF
jgi:hypothetical protein